VDGYIGSTKMLDEPTTETLRPLLLGRDLKGFKYYTRSLHNEDAHSRNISGSHSTMKKKANYISE
jgi:hypothetical protein